MPFSGRKKKSLAGTRKKPLLEKKKKIKAKPASKNKNLNER